MGFETLTDNNNFSRGPRYSIASGAARLAAEWLRYSAN